MKTQVDLQVRAIVALMAAALWLQPAAVAQQRLDSGPGQQVDQTVAAQHPAVSSSESTAGPTQPLDQQLPDSPGAVQSQINDGVQQSGGQPAAQSTQPQQNRLHEPVGTAAAEWMPLTGVAASRPAGAALAPAKQRRARSVLIKMGAVLGAGLAVGTVMALSAASPSKPPGAH